MNKLANNNQKSGVALDLKNLLASDKATLNEMVSDIIERVYDGWADPMDAMIYAKKGEYLFKAIIDGIKKKVELPEGKSFTKHNAVLAEQMVGVRYDYSNCNDPEWDTLTDQINSLDKRRKEREKYLKLITSPKTEIDVETGDIFEIEPPIKSGSLSIKLTLK